jgi:hypothetical protein
MLLIDELTNTKTCINGKWVIARPLLGPFFWRLKDALQVILGKADAVKFYKQ